MRLVENAEKVKNGVKPTLDILRIKYEMREDIETLAESDYSVFAGTYYRLEAFSLINYDPEWPEGATFKWSGPYDPKKVHYRYDEQFDGNAFRKLAMITLSDRSKDTDIIQADTNPCKFPLTEDITNYNAQRVAQGLTPLTFEEFEKIEADPD